jgi:leucyl/phenylalanyl-tRNA--protein transferase
MIRLPFLDTKSPDEFPPVEHALREPDGLLAAGGDLSPQRLLAAYAQGIFPWYSRGEPILWWSPDPRCVFATDRMHVSRRFARWLRGCDWRIGADEAFADVMRACAAPRPTQPTTWIDTDMLAAYTGLHALGHAHSVEIRDASGELVGGLYGVAIGRMFYGESMFSRRANASKLALLALARAMHRNDMPLLDAQVASAHLFRLGAFEMPREAFRSRIRALTARAPMPFADWRTALAAPAPAELLQ